MSSRRVVLRPDDEVLALLVTAWRVGEGEEPPDGDLSHVALGLGAVELRVQLVDAGAHVVVAVIRLDVLAGVVEHLVVRLLVRLDELGLHRQVRLGLGEVVVDQRRLAGLNALGEHPGSDVFLFGVALLVRGVVGDGRDVLQRFVARVRIHELEHVTAVSVFQVVVDALLFHQAADEVEVCLPVLDAILALGVLAGQVVLEHRDGVVGEHFLDDVGDRLLLKDAAVRGAREEPEPRPHGHRYS